MISPPPAQAAHASLSASTSAATAAAASPSSSTSTAGPSADNAQSTPADIPVISATAVATTSCTKASAHKLLTRYKVCFRKLPKSIGPNGGCIPINLSEQRSDATRKPEPFKLEADHRDDMPEVAGLENDGVIREFEPKVEVGAKAIEWLCEIANREGAPGVRAHLEGELRDQRCVAYIKSGLVIFRSKEWVSTYALSIATGSCTDDDFQSDVIEYMCLCVVCNKWICSDAKTMSRHFDSVKHKTAMEELCGCELNLPFTLDESDLCDFCDTRYVSVSITLYIFSLHNRYRRDRRSHKCTLKRKRDPAEEPDEEERRPSKLTIRIPALGHARRVTADEVASTSDRSRRKRSPAPSSGPSSPKRMAPLPARSCAPPMREPIKPPRGGATRHSTSRNIPQHSQPTPMPYNGGPQGPPPFFPPADNVQYQQYMYWSNVPPQYFQDPRLGPPSQPSMVPSWLDPRLHPYGPYGYPMYAPMGYPPAQNVNPSANANAFPSLQGVTGGGPSYYPGMGIGASLSTPGMSVGTPLGYPSMNVAAQDHPGMDVGLPQGSSSMDIGAASDHQATDLDVAPGQDGDNTVQQAPDVNGSEDGFNNAPDNDLDSAIGEILVRPLFCNVRSRVDLHLQAVLGTVSNTDQSAIEDYQYISEQSGFENDVFFDFAKYFHTGTRSGSPSA